MSDIRLLTKATAATAVEVTGPQVQAAWEAMARRGVRAMTARPVWQAVRAAGTATSAQGKTGYGDQARVEAGDRATPPEGEEGVAVWILNPKVLSIAVGAVAVAAVAAAKAAAAVR